MDDLTISGAESQAARDVELVRTKGEEIGLRLNTNKCEFIRHRAHSTDPIFNNFVHLSVDNAELLGAPITTGAAMDRALTRRCDDLDRTAGRLHHVTAHDALILLRASFSAPKLLHSQDFTMQRPSCSGEV